MHKCIPEPKEIGHTEMAELPKILAVDFDGTLVQDKFPNIGEKNDAVFAQVKAMQVGGWRIVLWTCRCGKQLHEATRYCLAQGLFFDAVNENIKEVQELFGGDTRKVYADRYLDDKNLAPYIPREWRNE